jgi:hypothetical protein
LAEAVDKEIGENNELFVETVMLFIKAWPEATMVQDDDHDNAYEKAFNHNMVYVQRFMLRSYPGLRTRWMEECTALTYAARRPLLLLLIARIWEHPIHPLVEGLRKLRVDERGGLTLLQCIAFFL